MDKITLNKNNRLFWLGRYAERVYQGVENIRNAHDQSIDGEAVDIDEMCKKLGILNQFTSVEDFCVRHCFDRTLSDSIICSADAMLGNGMVLRELLGSPTLSYLQMAVSALEMAKTSKAYAVQLQWVLDDIMAFRGSYAEFIDSEAIRNTIKSGASVERVGTMIRLGVEETTLLRELHKLMNRLYKTNLKYDTEKLEQIKKFVFNEEEHSDRFALLGSVESLFLI